MNDGREEIHYPEVDRADDGPADWPTLGPTPATLADSLALVADAKRAALAALADDIKKAEQCPGCPHAIDSHSAAGCRLCSCPGGGPFRSSPGT